jgi:hypothetical protein
MVSSKRYTGHADVLRKRCATAKPSALQTLSALLRGVLCKTGATAGKSYVRGEARPVFQRLPCEALSY